MSENEQDIDQGHGLVVEESRPRLKRPAMYRVVLLNDDYTPMEFVVQILEMIFSMNRTAATRVMLEVHTKGRGMDMPASTSIRYCVPWKRPDYA